MMDFPQCGHFTFSEMRFFDIYFLHANWLYRVKLIILGRIKKVNDQNHSLFAPASLNLMIERKFSKRI